MSQTMTHAPYTQLCPDGHALPHAPQLRVSLARVTHAPPHVVCPAPHAASATSVTIDASFASAVTASAALSLVAMSLAVSLMTSMGVLSLLGRSTAVSVTTGRSSTLCASGGGGDESPHAAVSTHAANTAQIVFAFKLKLRSLRDGLVASTASLGRFYTTAFAT